MISFQQQMKLALLVKISRKTAQELCDADGVNFLCKVTEIQPRAVCKVIWKLVRTMVQCYLQRMVLNGRKYKSVTSPQVDLQVTISWGNVLTLRVTRVETCRLEVLQAPGIYYWDAFTWTHPEKHHHWSFIAVMCARSNRIRWHAISHFLAWKMGHVIVQTSDMKKPFQRNFTFSPLWQKVWSISKFENRQVCSFFGCGVEVHKELYFMLHAWGFHHCGWTAFPHQMPMSIYAVHSVKAWKLWAEILVNCGQWEHVCGKWVSVRWKRRNSL